MVNALIDHLVCLVACMVHHTFGDAWQCYMMLVCICQPSMLWKLGCDGIIYFLIRPPSFTWPSVGLCCAAHLLCCLQQTCLEFRPDFLSSSSPFSFHSRHMCLEDFLEWATCLRRLSFHTFGRAVNLRLIWGGISIIMSHTKADAAEQPPLQESPSHP